MNPIQTCLLKNKITENFIYESEKNYLIPEKFEKFKNSELDKFKILEDSTSNNVQGSSNIFKTIPIIPVTTEEKILTEKKKLLIEIESIIEELEYFEKERRKNQIVELMKSITRNVNKSTIPKADDLLDKIFLGKSQNKMIEDDYINRKKLNKNNITNNQNFFLENSIIDINTINYYESKNSNKVKDINKLLFDDDMFHSGKNFLEKKTKRKDIDFYDINYVEKKKEKYNDSDSIDQKKNINKSNKFEKQDNNDEIKKLMKS